MFLLKEDIQRYTLGVVYEPDVVDTQDDFADAAEIEKACHEFMRHIQGKGSVKKGPVGLMHSDWSDDNGEVVECFLAPVDMTIGDQEVKKGSWLLGVIWSPEIFAKIQKGEINAYSMGGTGHRERGVEPTDSPFQKALRSILTEEGE